MYWTIGRLTNRTAQRTLCPASAEATSKPLNIQTLSFLDAINHFSGGLNYESVCMKAKSDYVFSPLLLSAIAAMLAAVSEVPVGGIAVLCDAYGGAISDLGGHRYGVSPTHRDTILHSIFLQLVGPN